MAARNRTEHLNLPRPSYDDNVDVKDIEQIVDTLDQELNTIKQVAQHSVHMSEAEQARVQAENARVSAEQTRQESENTRVGAESTRTQAETLRVSKEDERVQAEQTRLLAEQHRQTDERQRVESERARTTLYNEQSSKFPEWKQEETNRKSAETRRVKAEESRETGEHGRETAEQERVRAEQERVSAESARVSGYTAFEQQVRTMGEQESTRQTQEQERVRAEQERARQYASDHERATQDVAKTEAMLENIKRLETGELIADVAEIQTTFAPKAYVDDLIEKLIGGADDSLDTLKELADVLTTQGGDIQSILTQLSSKLPKDEATQLLTNLENKLTNLINTKGDTSELVGQINAKVSSSTFDEFKRTTESTLATKASASDLARIQSQVGENLQTTLNGFVNKSQIVDISAQDPSPFGSSIHWCEHELGEDGQIAVKLRSDGYFTANLIEGTKDFSGRWNGSGWGSDSTYSYGEFTTKIKSRAWGGLSKDIPVKANKKYVFSCYARMDKVGFGYLYLVDRNNSLKFDVYYQRRLDFSENWQRYWIEFTPKSDGVVSPNIQLSTNDNIYICGYCLVQSVRPLAENKVLSARSSVGLIDSYMYKAIHEIRKKEFARFEEITTQFAQTLLAPIDDLNSTQSNKALSANQGRVLKEMIQAKSGGASVVDNLTSTSTTSALSANQGKVLNDNLRQVAEQLGVTQQSLPSFPLGFKGIKVVSNEAEGKQQTNFSWLCMVLEE